LGCLQVAKIAKRLGTVYGETEKEALANAQKQFAKTEVEQKRHTRKGPAGRILGVWTPLRSNMPMSSIDRRNFLNPRSSEDLQTGLCSGGSCNE
jgi:hypothetical protein